MNQIRSSVLVATHVHVDRNSILLPTVHVCVWSTSGRRVVTLGCDSFQMHLGYFTHSGYQKQRTLYINYTTFNNGSLGSRIDEERSEMR